jgi:RND superfamily putative drug exporter
MALVGERLWWLPGWLDRLVPDLDIEGETLMHRLADDRRSDVGSRKAVGAPRTRRKAYVPRHRA